MTMQDQGMDRKAAQALFRSFFISNYIDLKNRSYTTLWAQDYVKNMLKDCDTAEKGFAAFFAVLVKPEFAEKVRTFCLLDTLPQRLKGRSQIDCEYLSNVAAGWCRISFLPTEWDENGEVSHVLFTVTAVDEEQAQEIEAGRFSRQNLKVIFDEVPGGIILYKWTGEALKVLKMSRYYKEIYGDYETEKGDIFGHQRIHPDDMEAYQRAMENALTKTHRLDHVFRIWNQKRNRYGWTQVSAIFKPQTDGTEYIYAVYTDITEQKIAQQRLKKSNASIVAALGASEQFSYEYDPVEHICTSFVKEDNGYHLDTVIRDYPECFRSSDFMHPEDVELFINTVHQIDLGAESAHCTIRANKDGKYHWHSCTFDAFYDSEKEYRVALLTVVDVTSQKTAVQNYEERINSLLAAQDSILTMCTFNLTQDTFEMVHSEESMNSFINHSASFERTMLGIIPDIVSTESREKYCRLFSRQNLLKQAEHGNMHIQLEYLLKVRKEHYEWILVAVDMVRNPISEEIEGVAYSKSTQKSHMERELLSSALKQDYLFSAVVFKDTEEFYIYNSEEDRFGDRKEHFWENDSNKISMFIRSFGDKEEMCRYLEENQEFTHAFESMYQGYPSRLEAKLRYLDEEHTTILVTMRDITDQRLLEQWRYDSEHDELTGLLNRKTVFKESRRFLKEHPEEQFIILHCDVRHFHLYNTFFGEEAGDRLLCKIAEVIQRLEKDFQCFTCGRIESDVFCVFVQENGNLSENYLKQCFHELEIFSPDFPLELAVGAYWVEDSEMSIEAMFSRATIAAKSESTNLFGHISRYDQGMEQRLQTMQQITSEMNSAVAQQQFVVYLQPKYALDSEKMVGAEALVRWKHPERGMISPAKFIPVFEQNGFIAELDRYMWEHVCQILHRWQEEGKLYYPVSVNISRVSMYSRSTVPFLKLLVKKYELDPKYLELELTETAYMDDPEELKRILRELQDYGFKILIDDFGSGYSSLNALRELPVNVLKLDMKFLTDSQNDPRANAVLSSVVRMSKMLELPIVAEGVEKREQADYLRELGCEYVQGYLFAKPMPVDEFAKLL